MAVGLPLPTNYTDGEVWSASDVNDITGTINTTAAPYAAGKNKIINGDFYVNQRGFTSSAAGYAYGLDRFFYVSSGGTATYFAQTFTAGAAPVSGYEGKNYARVVTTGQSASTDFAVFGQGIEDVRTFAGQTVTMSFWAKAASGTPKVIINFEQGFGSGGSANVQTIAAAATTLSTSWARYSVTVSIPSVTGKTIGTSSALYALMWLSAGTSKSIQTNNLISTQNNTFDIWGVQVEAGSVATPFQTATGTIQGELAACQRYYYQTSGQTYLGAGVANNTTETVFTTMLPVSMRATASVSVSAASDFTLSPGAKSVTSFNGVNTGGNSIMGFYTGGSSGLTANYSYMMNYTSGSGSLKFSAEL